MFGRKQDLELIKHRLDNIEKELAGLNSRFAIKLVEKIVLALAGAVLMGFTMAAINGNLATLIGG